MKNLFECIKSKHKQRDSVKLKRYKRQTPTKLKKYY